ncbi:MAG TPA: Tfx family DNA-binding protein [Conexivisphaerales archaeon]|nr:Tfx family DNA-binding protein [Conexivisphaerales archaeon]
MVKKEPFHGTTLTDRQWEVIRLRSDGLTQAEVAKRLKTTRENISIIEHRAHDKISAAKATLAALQELEVSQEVLIPSGTSVFEAVSMLVIRADILGIKLKQSADALLALLRSRCRSKIRGHHLVAVIKAEISEGGEVTFKMTV